MEEEANKKLNEAEVLADEYNGKIEKINSEVYKDTQSKKHLIEEKEKENLKKAEVQINLQVYIITLQVKKIHPCNRGGGLDNKY